MSQLESKAAPEVQAEAQKMGWIPPDRYKKAPDQFVDADVYVERGKVVLPILKETNKRLEAELEATKAANLAQGAALRQVQDSIATIEERHAVELQKTRERTRDQVKAQLAAANAEGDHEAVAELTDQLVKINAQPEVPAPTKQAPAPAPVAIDPELKAWNAENAWFGTDKRKTALALAIAQELREGGDRSTGRAFYEKVAAELDTTLGAPAAPDGSSKVEGARNGSGNDGPRSGAKKGYDSLPSEARAACDADTRNFVGPNKRYKTAAEWRNRYAEIYYGD